jgi:ABC-type nitrate/sulfonate/bicarbonate transport system substrate-binding protein
MRLRLVSVGVLAVFAIALAACMGGAPRTAANASATIASTPRALRDVTFMAGFKPQANLAFVAAYVAQEKGYFTDDGLRVSIKHAAGQDEHLKLLLAKEIQFTTATGAQAVLRYADGLPVRAVALWGQRGDQGYVAKADSGIKGPADFKGRSVGIKSGVVPAELQAMLAGVGLSQNDVKLQGVGFDPRVFVQGAVDVYPVFLSNEPYAIRKTGTNITVFDPADYGVSTLGLTYLAHADTTRDDPALVRSFLRATLRGAQFAIDHPDEAVQITLHYADGADPGQQRYLLDTDIAAAKRADGIGRSSASQWQSLQTTLAKYGVLTKPVDANGAWYGAAVDSLYDAQGKLR